MGKKILYISDLDFKGSGYMQISVPLCKGLVEMGYDIRIIGLNYAGNEHDFPFSIIPCNNFKDAHAMIHNLNILDKPDVVIVALDLPHQGFFLERIKGMNLKYICITPLENPPLTMSWAAPLLNCDAVFFISEMGAQAARDAGVYNAQHIQIGIDENWKVPTEEDRKRIRETMDLDSKFVVLVVADNQERKNLWAALEIISRVKQSGVDNLQLIMITREHLQFGWKLRDLTTELGINSEVMILERGMPFGQLWTFYAAADLYLNTSKAEGLGLPVLEAMACGVPVLTNHTGALPELLEGGKGFTVPPIYSFRDVWGNAWRDMINVEAAAIKMRELMEQDLSETISKAKKYVDSRTWDIPTKQVADAIEEVTNG